MVDFTPPTQEEYDISAVSVGHTVAHSVADSLLLE